MEAQLAEAQRAYEAAPTDADSIIWLGRRQAYLGRYREAITTYTKGIALHPDDPRLYRHRGHRYITVRMLDSAVADLEHAYQLIQNRPDEVEPDGQPNAQGIPVSTLNSNIRYHLGLAHYLQGDFDAARRYFDEDVAVRVNDDMLVASSYWLHLSLRRLGREDDAAWALEPITADLNVIENHAYYRLLRYYQAAIEENQVWAGAIDPDAALEDVTLSYGMGIWYLLDGRRADARKVFERIITSSQWAAFGYLAAEAELARWGR